MGKIITTEKFIKDVIIVHNDVYDYSLVEYKNAKENIKIVCKKHGAFHQLPSNHKKGSGCPKCHINKIKEISINVNSEKFLSQSNKTHKYKYDYSLINYTNSDTKVEIVCKKHGIFEQTPYCHKKGSGCPKCAKNYKLNTINFIKNADKTHNNRYDYSLVNYKNSKTKIEIICKEHGIFKQTPNSHLSGRGCCKCQMRIHSIDDYVLKCNKIHNNKYDYSKLKFLNHKIKIICKEHGIFKQDSNSHKNGIGCPKCHSSKGEDRIRNFLKENNILFEEQKSFENLKCKYKLRFDFYLPIYNITIEYDGIQHFKINEFFGGRSAYMKLKHRDGLKNKYCNDNNINLVRIPYTDFDNIEKKLIEII